MADEDWLVRLADMLTKRFHEETPVTVRRHFVERVGGELVTRAVVERGRDGAPNTIISGHDWLAAQELSENTAIAEKADEPGPVEVVEEYRPVPVEAAEPIRVAPDGLEAAIKGYTRARAVRVNGRGR